MVVLFCQAAQIQGAETRSLPEEAGPPRPHLLPSRMPLEPHFVAACGLGQLDRSSHVQCSYP